MSLIAKPTRFRLFLSLTFKYIFIYISQLTPLPRNLTTIVSVLTTLSLQPIRDILPNTAVSTSDSESNRLKSGDIDADIKEGVSILESDISKTIENIEQLVHAKNANISPLVEPVAHEHESIEIASKKPSSAIDYVVVEDVANIGDDDQPVAVETNEDAKEALPTTTVLSSTEVPAETSTLTLAEIVTETVTPTMMTVLPTTVRPDMDSTVTTRLSTFTAKVSLPLHLHNLT